MNSDQKYNNNGNLSFLLHDVSRRVARAFDKQMEPMGLTRSQWNVVVYVAREPGIAQSRLADKLSIGRMAVTGLIDRLEEKGFLERRDDASDRRVKRIYISDSAEEIIPKLQIAAETVGAAVFSGLSDPDRSELIRLLLSVKNQANQVDVSARPDHVL